MKKYILLSFVIALVVITGCVKDQQPTPASPPPVDYSSIKINELITKDITDPYYVDETGKGADWVELYNNGNKAIDIAGMYITDAPGDENSYEQIPDTDAGVTTIPPKGFLVLICGAKDGSGNHYPTGIKDGKIFIDMGLSSSKDHFVAIYSSDKKEIDKSDDFGGLEDDKSFGRKTDGGTPWEVLEQKTPGKSNNGTEPVQGTLVINEFMSSNNSWSIPGEDPSATFPDWIEIYNTGDTPIDMAGWYVTDDLDTPDKYQIPSDDPNSTVVPPHGFLLIICDKLDTGLHTNFKLSSGGEAVGISENGTEISDGYTYCPTGCDVPGPESDNSCGRDGDGNPNWVIFQKDGQRKPTPGASND